MNNKTDRINSCTHCHTVDPLGVSRFLYSANDSFCKGGAGGSVSDFIVLFNPWRFYHVGATGLPGRQDESVHVLSRKESAGLPSLTGGGGQMD